MSSPSSWLVQILQSCLCRLLYLRYAHVSRASFFLQASYPLQSSTSRLSTSESANRSVQISVMRKVPVDSFLCTSKPSSGQSHHVQASELNVSLRCGRSEI